MSDGDKDGAKRSEGDPPLEESTLRLGESTLPSMDREDETGGAGRRPESSAPRGAPADRADRADRESETLSGDASAPNVPLTDPSEDDRDDTIIVTQNDRRDSSPGESSPAADFEPPSARAGPSPTETPVRNPIAPSSSLHPLLIERIEPSLGRGERLRLDAAHWTLRLGRGEDNDVRLYTASASREHAVISGTAEGEWVLTPMAGKTVKIDGDPTGDPVVLEVGMNLQMGGDHLRCVTEGLARADMQEETLAEGATASGPNWIHHLRRLTTLQWTLVVLTLIATTLLGVILL